MSTARLEQQIADLQRERLVHLQKFHLLSLQEQADVSAHARALERQIEELEARR